VNNLGKGINAARKLKNPENNNSGMIDTTKTCTAPQRKSRST